MLITLKEIFDIVVMSIIVGIIFAGLFPRRKKPDFFTKKFGFSWQALKFACFITAPALVFHELAHKFIAIALGHEAVFHAFYFGLLFGLIIRFTIGLIFFIPGYVSIPAMEMLSKQAPLQLSIIAIAGPLANLGMFIIAHLLLKLDILKKPKYRALALITKKINLILFIFNMLPIPPLDGWKFFYGLYHALF